MSPVDPTPATRLVLIVDDLEENRSLLDRALKTAGYDTRTAASGREALSLISERVPDIVLLDWMMPGLSGLDTLRAIRDLHSSSRLPVIMCTALDEETSVVAALGAGATDYITKPISLAILRARMKTHLDQQRVIHDLDRERSRAERRLTEQARALFSSLDDERPYGKGH